MSQEGTHPDLITYSLLLKSCIRANNFQQGKLFHDYLTQSGLKIDSVILNSLIGLYSKCDLVSWSALISCYANNRMDFEAVNTYIDMLNCGFYPNEYCYTAVIRACSNKDNVSIGQIIFGSVIKSGYFDSHVCVGCALIDVFVMGSGDFNAAYKVFDKMTEKNVITWTLLITRLQQFGYSRDAIDFFINMVSSEYIPDKYTLSGVFSASIKSGLFLDVCVGCSLVDMYAKCATDGFMGDSRKVFDRMSDHNVMSWTAIVTGYVQRQVKPKHFTFSSILKACANLSDLHMGEQVFAYAVKLGLASVNCVANSLISMLDV
ncbi:hypothetical protein P3X46_025075, partial [Hevea brasiliensis]